LNWDDYLTAELRDPQHARVYLETALEEFLEDQDRIAFLRALRNIANAQGGIGKLAERTGLNRENLFRVLGGKSNPRLDTLDAILGGLGFRLSVKPLQRQETMVRED
jgi:probable addiction module antidote protein